MHEFSLAEKSTNLVLCVIYKKNKKTEEMGLDLERPSVVDSIVLGSLDVGQDPLDRLRVCLDITFFTEN